MSSDTISEKRNPIVELWWLIACSGIDGKISKFIELMISMKWVFYLLYILDNYNIYIYKTITYIEWFTYAQN